jgi:segregation and condensation protein A
MDFKLEQFEGPLGLLLSLIEKEEMDITHVSLARVADQYIDFIKSQENIDPDEMADFLVVAAKLLLIKSKALLPFLYPEEEQEIEEFQEQLRMYKEFLEASKKIEKMIGRKKFMFAREFNRQAILQNIKLFSPPRNMTKEMVEMVFNDILGRLITPEKLEEEKLERKISIEEKILHIQQSLVQRIKTSFSSLLNGTKSKTEIIVSFLAMLELVKQREIVAEQDELFEEILINRLGKEGGASRNDL